MKRYRNLLLCLGLAVPVLLVSAAEKLNVKPGLWEITSETRMAGMPPLPKELLEMMTAEQREAMQAAIKAQSEDGPIRDTSQECVTQEDLENPFNAEDLENCEQTVVNSSATRQEFRLVCTGERAGEGSFRINTPTPETMAGDFDLKVSNGADTMTITAKMEGKWLKADCGAEE